MPLSCTPRVDARLSLPPRARRTERGAAAVEFALVMIPMVTLLLGTLQFAYWFYSAQSTSSAGRETARRLTVGDCQDLVAAGNFARGQANVRGLTLTYGAPGATATAVTNPGSLPAATFNLRVVVTSNANIIGLFPMPNGGTVTQVINTRVEDTTPGTPAC